MKLVFYRTHNLLRKEKFSWFLQAGNGEKLARSEGYSNRGDCEDNATKVTNFKSRSLKVERRW